MQLHNKSQEVEDVFTHQANLWCVCKSAKCVQFIVWCMDEGGSENHLALDLQLHEHRQQTRWMLADLIVFANT